MAPPESGSGGSGADGNGEGKESLTGHKRLEAAWFGKDGDGNGGGGGKEVPREQFLTFVRDLRMDVKTVECRLYSRSM